MRLGIVGAGVMGKNHARVIAGRPDIQLAGVYDPVPGAAQAVGRAHGVPAFATLDDLLRIPDVEGVVVAAPTAQHHAVAMQALQADKHVLVEKPVAATVAEAQDLVKHARRRGRVLAVGHVERHNPIVAYTREALRAGEFGQLIHVGTRRVSSLPGRIRDVGVIYDLGIHDIDVVRFLADSPVDRVYAAGGTFTPGLKFEDHASILLRFVSGITGSIEVNWLTPMKVRRLSLTASRCYVEADYIEQRALVATSTFGRLDEANIFKLELERSERVIQLKKQEPLALEIEDFAAAIRGNRARPLVDGDDGVEALRIAEAAVASAREGRAVPVRAA